MTPISSRPISGVLQIGPILLNIFNKRGIEHGIELNILEEFLEAKYSIRKWLIVIATGGAIITWVIIFYLGTNLPTTPLLLTSIPMSGSVPFAWKYALKTRRELREVQMRIVMDS